MALLRQCLQQLRVKQHDWDIPDAGWPETPFGARHEPGLEPHRGTLSQGLAALAPSRRTDGLHVRALHA